MNNGKLQAQDGLGGKCSSRVQLAEMVYKADVTTDELCRNNISFEHRASAIENKFAKKTIHTSGKHTGRRRHDCIAAHAAVTVDNGRRTKSER